MTIKDITIGVVIPLYNGAAYIADAVNSVLGQTLKPDDIVVVDDGSTDDGPAIVEEIAKTHPVRLLRKPNGGQSSARNFGIRATSTTHIALLDQDDMWYPDHLEALIEPFLEENRFELGWTYSNLDEVDDSGSMVVRSFLDMLPGKHPKRDLFVCLQQDMFVLPSASIISRKAFDSVGGFDESLSGYEDDDLFLRIFRQGYDNIYIDKALSKWRIHSSSSSYSPRMARSRMAYLRKLVVMFPNNPERDRMYTRDMLAPRFLPPALADYGKAVVSGDKDQVSGAIQNLRVIAHYHRRHVRLLITLAAPLLRCRWLMRRLIPVLSGFRPMIFAMLR